MNILPELEEVTLYKLPAHEILNLCSVNKRFEAICKTDKFWSRYIHHNYNPFEIADFNYFEYFPCGRINS
jgi:hypothetical protein